MFFLSDNGGLRFEGKRPDPITANVPFRAGKGHLYEGGMRVPTIVRWPGKVAGGAVSETPVSTVDVYPTILDIAGAAKNGHTPIDGLSLTPVLQKKGGLKRDALYWHYPHYSNQGGPPGGAVRQGDFKLIEFYEDEHVELYNLRDDVGEKANLARKLPKKAAELHSLLKRWRGQVNARMPQPNPAHNPAEADQGLTGAEAKTEPI